MRALRSSTIPFVMSTILWTGQAAQAPEPPTVLLTEVLADPANGDTAFVELLNTGREPIVLTSLVLRIDTVTLPLPRTGTPFAPGTRVVIRFDGRGTVDGNIVHAGLGFELRAAGGSVSLRRNDGRGLDHFAWGDARGAFVPSIGGLAMTEVERGSSYGRPPGVHRAGALHDWVVYPPGQATPGGANPLPPVEQLLPMHGAILEGTSAELSWYAVPGAARYRVQFARDTTFAQPIINQVIDAPPLSTGRQAAGVYWWRVQAIPAEGTPSAWSLPSLVELGVPTPTGSGGTGSGAADDAQDHGGPADTAPGHDGSAAWRALNVPLLFQHKDSKMLHMELIQEGRPRTSFTAPHVPHAWDRDHGALDLRDPADGYNCALASMAMINRFYGGDLTQDRIGYEVWSRNILNYRARILAGPARALMARLFAAPADFVEREPGPEQDLHHGQGMPWGRLIAAGVFALGALPGAGSGFVPGSGSLTLDSIWNAVVTEIDAGRPVFAAIPGHAIVIRGYELQGSRRLLFINDPGLGRYRIDLDVPRATPMGRRSAQVGIGLRAIWTFPNPTVRRQEREVSADTDTDGVVDFDEIQRFRTDPANDDTDGDGVRDGRDIASGVFEAKGYYGYAYAPSPNDQGRDFDFDGVPTELDPDSDNGGCKDGEEDTNGNGETDGAETDNFDATDDACGNLVGNVSYLIAAINTDPSSVVKEIMDKGVILVKLAPDAAGSETYVDAGSTYSYHGHARIEIVAGPNCILWGHELSRGSGPFTSNGEIGAAKGDDGTLALGARADVPAQTSAGGCGQGGTSQAERTLNFPDCIGRLVQRPAGPRGPPQAGYRFDCTTKPQLGPGWTVTQFYARGFVVLRTP